MKSITSKDNTDYRLLLRAMAGKRAPGDRAEPPLIAIEGVHLCESWLEHIGQPEYAFFDGERQDHPELARLLRSVEPGRARLCTPALMRAASDVVHGQGVIFVGRVPHCIVSDHITANSLWLDRVQDPGNMGTLLRTAAAAGIVDVYASTGCVSAWAPKVLRSAQGAHFVLAIHEGLDLQVLRERLRIPLIATALEQAVSLHETRLPRHAAWIFGNEGRGVAPALLASADMRIRIPQSEKVESLNVAVAAGVCLFEQRRQHPQA